MIEAVANLYRVVTSVAEEITRLRAELKQKDDEIRGLKVRIRILKETS